jgi:hypothetical protein
MRKLLALVATFCAASLNLAAFDMDYKTFNSKTIKSSDELKGLSSVDSGHYKTLINLKDMPAGLKFTVINDRKLVNALGQETVKGFTRDDLTKVRSTNGEMVPCFVISGKGFLPGERVTVKFACEDGTVSSVDVVPYPLYDRNEKGDVIFHAELKNTAPAGYEITADGLNEGEELEFLTTAGKSKETFKVKYQEGKGIAYLPSIKKGGLSGTSHLVITRENGEQFNFDLPWGTEFSKYSKGKIKPGV